MEPLSYVLSLVNRNVFIRRIPVKFPGNERFYLWPNPVVICVLIFLWISHSFTLLLPLIALSLIATAGRSSRFVSSESAIRVSMHLSFEPAFDSQFIPQGIRR